MAKRTSTASSPIQLAAIFAAVAALALGLLAPTASAAPKVGGWTGTLLMENGNPYANAGVTFRVVNNGKGLQNWTTKVLPVYCPIYYPFTFQTRTVQIPSAAIRSGKVNRKYTVRSDSGQPVGTLILKGTFTSRRKVKGTISYQDSGCYGTTHWRAHKR